MSYAAETEVRKDYRSIVIQQKVILTLVRTTDQVCQ